MLKELWYTLCASCKPRKSKTVEYAFPLVIIATLFASAAAVISEKESFITIETRPATVREGETFFIDVSVSAHTPVNAVDVVIDYPETQMEVSGIDIGESVITLWTEEPYEKNGKVYLRGGTFQKGFLGEHLIARIKGVATESGTAYVTTDSAKFIAGDGLGTEVAVTEDESINKTKIYITNADGSLVGEATVTIVTDIDGDGDVDLGDISAFMSAWFNKNKIFDFNGDGKMSFRDFSILLADSFFR